MVILRTRNKITDFLMILAWVSPFNLLHHVVVVAKRVCAAAAAAAETAAHEGDDNTPSGPTGRRGKIILKSLVKFIQYSGKKYILYFSVYSQLFLLLGRPGAGYITNASYTLLKSEIARGHFLNGGEPAHGGSWYMRGIHHCEVSMVKTAIVVEFAGYYPGRDIHLKYGKW